MVSGFPARSMSLRRTTARGGGRRARLARAATTYAPRPARPPGRNNPRQLPIRNVVLVDGVTVARAPDVLRLACDRESAPYTIPHTRATLGDVSRTSADTRLPVAPVSTKPRRNATCFFLFEADDTGSSRTPQPTSTMPSKAFPPPPPSSMRLRRSRRDRDIQLYMPLAPAVHALTALAQPVQQAMEGWSPAHGIWHRQHARLNLGRRRAGAGSDANARRRRRTLARPLGAIPPTPTATIPAPSHRSFSPRRVARTGRGDSCSHRTGPRPQRPPWSTACGLTVRALAELARQVVKGRSIAFMTDQLGTHTLRPHSSVTRTDRTSACAEGENERTWQEKGRSSINCDSSWRYPFRSNDRYR